MLIRQHGSGAAQRQSLTTLCSFSAFGAVSLQAATRPEVRKAIEAKDNEKIQAEIAELEKEQEEITKLIAMLKNLEK